MQAYFASLASAPLAAELAIKGALWLAIIFLVTFALRNASAATRHLVLCIGILGLFALPLIAPRVEWRVAVPARFTPPPTVEQRTSVPTVAQVSSEAEVTNDQIAETALGARPSSPETDTAANPGVSVTAILLVLWAVGALLLVVRLTSSLLSARRIVARAEALADERLQSLAASLARRVGVQRPVRLLTAQNATIPFTTGVLRPVIVLPADAEDWTTDRQEAVLLHELAHVARFDLASSLAAHAACALYWFNPLAWVAARRLRIEGERACDDVVLRCGTRASDYADQLLEVVRETKLHLAPAVAVAMARRSAFEGRLLAILSPETNRARVTLRLATPIALGMALIALPIAAMRPATAAVQSENDPQQLVDGAAPADSAPVTPVSVQEKRQ
ncbi:MAG: M56 family metallopeptidase, partial [Gemmatimonadota bacterium]